MSYEDNLQGLVRAFYKTDSKTIETTKNQKPTLNVLIKKIDGIMVAKAYKTFLLSVDSHEPNSSAHTYNLKFT